MATHECDGCGACCRTFAIYVSQTDAGREPRIRDESLRLRPWLTSPERAYQLFPLPFHETCCFLGSDNRCTIYATRPDLCRHFEAGSDECQEARRRSGLPELKSTAEASPKVF
jgi:Fe-S-cluster containining protein